MAEEANHMVPAGEAHEGGETHATTEAHHAPDPAIGGAGGYLNATTIVSIAMAVFILVLIWKKVPAVIGKALDGQIAGIRSQLEEAAKLRAEAEALKAEYQKKLDEYGAQEAAALVGGGDKKPE